MAYSTVGIANRALLRIGADIIASLSENSPNAIKVNAIYADVRDEVLQARDWKFAVTRAKLVVSATTPLYGYNFAYAMPSDFLRLKKWRNTDSRGLNPASNPSGYLYQFVDHTGFPPITAYDPPVYPADNPYVVEALPDGTFCLLTNYDNTEEDLIINYVKQETNAARYSPTFVSLLAFKLAAELAISITESINKAANMETMYQRTLKSAAAVNESLDFLPDETGSSSWESAGR